MLSLETEKNKIILYLFAYVFFRLHHDLYPECLSESPFLDILHDAEKAYYGYIYEKEQRQRESGNIPDPTAVTNDNTKDVFLKKEKFFTFVTITLMLFAYFYIKNKVIDFRQPYNNGTVLVQFQHNR